MELRMLGANMHQCQLNVVSFQYLLLLSMWLHTTRSLPLRFLGHALPPFQFYSIGHRFASPLIGLPLAARFIGLALPTICLARHCRLLLLAALSILRTIIIVILLIAGFHMVCRCRYPSWCKCCPSHFARYSCGWVLARPSVGRSHSFARVASVYPSQLPLRRCLSLRNARTRG